MKRNIVFLFVLIVFILGITACSSNETNSTTLPTKTISTPSPTSTPTSTPTPSPTNSPFENVIECIKAKGTVSESIYTVEKKSRRSNGGFENFRLYFNNDTIYFSWSEVDSECAESGYISICKDDSNFNGQILKDWTAPSNSKAIRSFRADCSSNKKTYVDDPKVVNIRETVPESLSSETEQTLKYYIMSTIYYRMNTLAEMLREIGADIKDLGFDSYVIRTFY